MARLSGTSAYVVELEDFNMADALFILKKTMRIRIQVLRKIYIHSGFKKRLIYW